MTVSFIRYLEIKKESIPDSVLFIIKRLEGAGFLSFLVGGCVRDLICQKISKDWDIVTDASPGQIKKTFFDYKTLLIGRSFQTITLIIDSRTYHISTIRGIESKVVGENRENNLLAEQERYQLIINDLLCRDFTINSLAWNPDKGILDPSDGLPDLNRKLIRSLKPAIRFKEDPLRMIRAIRIACQLNFTIDCLTGKSIRKHAFLINRVSPERIREELYAVFQTSEAKKGIILLRQYGLEQFIFSIDKVKRERMGAKEWELIPSAGFDEFREELFYWLAVWGRFSFGSCRQAQILYIPLLYNLKFHKEIIKKLKILLSREWIGMDYSSGKNIRVLMSELGKENCKTMFYLKKMLLWSEKKVDMLAKLEKEEELLKNELRKKPPISFKDLAIKGEDLIEMGIPEGKRLGEVLQSLLTEVLFSPENNNKDFLIRMVERIQTNYLSS